MPIGESLAILPGVFHLTLIHNKGIAFGLFGGHDQVLFYLISISILVLIFLGHRLSWEFQKADVSERPRFWKLELISLALILGGALGNWVDRIRWGAVTDFLDFRVWPVFNLADSAITIGVVIYLIYFFRQSQKTV